MSTIDLTNSRDVPVGASATFIEAPESQNWIPTDPARNFELMLRLYAPTQDLFEKKWKLGDVEENK